MEKRKRIISAMLVAAMTLSSVMSGSVLAAKKTSDGLTYKVSGNYATITGYKGKSAKVTIPEKIGKSIVNKIGKNAFIGNSTIKSVSVPKSVTDIQYGAFGGASSLSKVTFASGSKLKTIGTWAFGRSGIKSITMPDTVTKLGTFAFSECGYLKKAKLSAGLKAIPERTFYWDTALTKINIPKSVESIDDYAFINCTGLSSVTGGSGVKSVGIYAFAWNNSLRQMDLKNVKNVSYGAFQETAIETVDYTASGVSVGETAHFRSNLREVSFPKSVTSIEYGAFNGCELLYNVKLPEKIGSITGGCFNNTSWIRSQKNPVYVGDNLLLGRTGQTSVSIKAGTKKICEFAFEGENKLGSVTIPDGVEVIGEGAFFDTDLTSVTIPDSVTEIGNLALGYKLYTTAVDFNNYYDALGEFDSDAYEAAVAKEKEGRIILSYNYWNSYGYNDDTVIDTKYCYGECEKIKGFTIRGKAGSAAEVYAKAFGFDFKAI